MKYIVYLFLFLMIFTNAFALNSVLTPSFAISFLLILDYLRFPKKSFQSKPHYLLYFWLLLTFSFVVVSDGEKCRNHWLLWTYPFFTYFFVFKNELSRLFTLEEIKSQVLKVIAFATIFACAFSTFEFCCSNFLGIDLNFIPRGTVEDYTPFDGFFRARSFAEESGHFSFFVEIFGPLSIYWILNNLNASFKLVTIGVIVLGLVATMSAVGLLFMFVYIGMFANFYIVEQNSKVSAKFLFLISLIAILVVITVVYPEVFSTIWDLIMMKLNPENVSHADRASRFSAIEKMSGIAYLIGYGPAAFSTLNVDSFISFYLGVFMNTGIIGLWLFLCFCLSIFHKIKSIRDANLRFALKTSFFFACAHLAFIDIIYVPWFWVMLSIAEVVSKKNSKII